MRLPIRPSWRIGSCSISTGTIDVEHPVLFVALIAAIIGVAAIVVGAILGVIIIEVRRYTLYRGRHF